MSLPVLGLHLSRLTLTTPDDHRDICCLTLTAKQRLPRRADKGLAVGLLPCWNLTACLSPASIPTPTRLLRFTEN